jgi:hypothetical protein
MHTHAYSRAHTFQSELTHSGGGGGGGGQSKRERKKERKRERDRDRDRDRDRERERERHTHTHTYTHTHTHTNTEHERERERERERPEVLGVFQGTSLHFVTQHLADFRRGCDAEIARYQSILELLERLVSGHEALVSQGIRLYQGLLSLY